MENIGVLLCLIDEHHLTIAESVNPSLKNHIHTHRKKASI